MTVEVCANSLQSALNAEAAGADRIELCAELAVGGVTPSYGMVKIVREHLGIPIHVLIRPRSGDFTYSEQEFQIMKTDIEKYMDLGCEGIVSGALKPDGSLDRERTAKLREYAGEAVFTFHRAFDWVRSPMESARILDGLGVDYLLSSGRQPSAELGIALLERLQDSMAHCAVLPGGGIGVQNAKAFKERGFKCLHLSALKFHKTFEGNPRISMNSPTLLKDSEIGISDLETLRHVVGIVK